MTQINGEIDNSPLATPKSLNRSSPKLRTWLRPI